MLESLFNNVAGFQSCNFIRKRLQHRCFSENIAKFLRKPILKKHLPTAASVDCKKIYSATESLIEMKFK